MMEDMQNEAAFNERRKLAIDAIKEEILSLGAVCKIF